MTNNDDADFATGESLEYFESLLVWVEGGPRDPRLERQAAADPLGLAHQRSLVDALVQDLEGARLESLAPGQRKRAFAALAQTTRFESAPGWRRLVGRLVHSSGAAPFKKTVAVCRGPSGFQGGQYNALFDAGAFDVDLHLAEDGALLGQVVSTHEDEEFPGGGVALLQTRAGDLRTSPIEEDGEFFFTQAPRETVDLILNMTRLEIVVRDVDLMKA
ncbi:MAG: hypothetical protein ACI8QS_003256 [Planctomycetota bacterium]|jgi:hypothetical protein